MSHDVNIESDKLEAWLKVNGCEQALWRLFHDSEHYYQVYNRSGELALTQELLLQFINDVINIDWKDKAIPDWVIEQLDKMRVLADGFDFFNSKLTLTTQ